MQDRKVYSRLFSISGKEPDADLGPLISPAAKERVISLIDSGIKDGAELLLDGRKVNVPGYENGNFVGPTILNKVDVSIMSVCYFCKLVIYYMILMLGCIIAFFMNLRY